jgi:hypothetical protein
MSSPEEGGPSALHPFHGPTSAQHSLWGSPCLRDPPTGFLGPHPSAGVLSQAPSHEPPLLPGEGDGPKPPPLAPSVLNIPSAVGSLCCAPRPHVAPSPGHLPDDPQPPSPLSHRTSGGAPSPQAGLPAAPPPPPRRPPPEASLLCLALFAAQPQGGAGCVAAAAAARAERSCAPLSPPRSPRLIPFSPPFLFVARLDRAASGKMAAPRPPPARLSGVMVPAPIQDLEALRALTALFKEQRNR